MGREVAWTRRGTLRGAAAAFEFKTADTLNGFEHPVSSFTDDYRVKRPHLGLIGRRTLPAREGGGEPLGSGLLTRRCP
jgi:hypothetical protein